MLQHSVQSMGVCDRGPDGKTCVAFRTFFFPPFCLFVFFVLESEMCECQQRNAMNGMGCTGESLVRLEVLKMRLAGQILTF